MVFYDKRCEASSFEDDLLSLANGVGDIDLEMNEYDLYNNFSDDTAEAEGFQVQEVSGGDEEPEAPPSTPEQCEGYLRRFFEGKSMYCGGPISKNHLLCKKHVEMVLRIELSDCLDIFHYSLDENMDSDRQWKSILNRVELFKELEANSAAQQIPKHHFGGLLLVYLILCKGYEL